MVEGRGGGSDPLARIEDFLTHGPRWEGSWRADSLEAVDEIRAELAGLRGRLAETEADRDNARASKNVFAQAVEAATAEIEALRVERDTAVAVVEAARVALTAWIRMPDAGLTDDDPRSAWWFETAPARDALREALAAVGGPTA